MRVYNKVLFSRLMMGSARCDGDGGNTIFNGRCAIFFHNFCDFFSMDCGYFPFNENNASLSITNISTLYE